MDIERLSGRYAVRAMDERDADEILRLCEGNDQFYRYCEAEPTREQVLKDLRLTPPGVEPSRKHYVGFYDGDRLAAVMDVVEGYPDEGTDFIGFFMMNRALQGAGLGTAIIAEAADYLKSIGIRRLRLAIDKGNPQSTHFWRKNGFAVVKEVDRNGWTALVAERWL